MKKSPEQIYSETKNGKAAPPPTKQFGDETAPDISTELAAKKPKVAMIDRGEVLSRKKPSESEMELLRYETESRQEQASGIVNNKNRDAHKFSQRQGADRFTPEPIKVSLHLQVELPAIVERLGKLDLLGKAIQDSSLMTNGAKAARYGQECVQTMVGITGLFEEIIQPLEKKVAGLANTMHLKMIVAKESPDSKEVRDYIINNGGFDAFASDPDACMVCITAPKLIQKHALKLDDKRMERAYKVALGDVYIQHSELTGKINESHDEFKLLSNKLQKHISSNQDLIDELNAIAGVR